MIDVKRHQAGRFSDRPAFAFAAARAASRPGFANVTCRRVPTR
jgi:hypothetical protein